MKLMSGHKQEGLLGLFTSPAKLVESIGKVRGAHITKLEAFTPFPVHEVIHALGLKRSWIPWATFVFGLSGAGLLFLFQAWTSSVAWPLNVGGKPLISWPAFIPITFEGMILLGGVLTVVTLFAVLRLPNRNKAILDPRLTNDHFGLFIEKSDPLYDEAELNKIFVDCGCVEVKQIHED